MNDTVRLPIKVPINFNVGHISTSNMARDQYDKTQRNQRDNLMVQDEQNNKNLCKNIELHMRGMSKRNK